MVGRHVLQEPFARAAPELGGLAGLLDQDGDGSVVDDLTGLGGGLLGKLLGGR